MSYSIYESEGYITRHILTCHATHAAGDFDRIDFLTWNEWCELIPPFLAATRCSLRTSVSDLRNINSDPDSVEEEDIGCHLLEQFAFYAIATQVEYFAQQFTRIRGAHLKRLDLVIDMNDIDELDCLLHLPPVLLDYSPFPELRNLNILLRADADVSWPDKDIIM
ncbi:hypothetical protein OBBRIDRAFT_804023 [Obba rivulosa]|uniref:Uncharacterized protein n=1 Tax=Obba rivulosa TaxID=1052685 RepID=A0A8E2ASW5_9APHY|nr:hypothetical protein OBBRIDRAFT_804023 [Obba rivulosa]